MTEINRSCYLVLIVGFLALADARRYSYIIVKALENPWRDDKSDYSKARSLYVR